MNEYIFDMGDALYDMDTGKAVFQTKPVGKLVRCKNCENWDEQDHWCNIRDSYRWDYKPDDFCSYADRKEGDEE